MEEEYRMLGFGQRDLGFAGVGDGSKSHASLLSSRVDSVELNPTQRKKEAKGVCNAP